MIYDIKRISAYIHTRSQSVAKKLHKTIEIDIGDEKLGKPAVSLTGVLAFETRVPCARVESPCEKF
jgi:hypothetical protein